MWNTATLTCQGEEPGVDAGAGRFCHFFTSKTACGVQSTTCKWDVTNSVCAPIQPVGYHLRLKQSPAATNECETDPKTNWYWAGGLVGSNIITALSVVLYCDQRRKREERLANVSLDEVLISTAQ